MLMAFVGCFAPKGEVKSDGKGADNAEEIRSDEQIGVNNVLFIMKYVQGGKCKIGGPSNAQSTTVNSFYMGETEVTQQLWIAVMGKNPSWFKDGQLDFHWGKEDNMFRPVEKVSWEDCQEFIKKLNELTGKNFRLPTYAEWEYAAKGGRKGKNTRYAGSDDINAVAWYDRNSGWSEITEKTTISLRTQEVAQKEPNELGLYDMTGNVREWVQERQDNMAVTRGGGFHSSPADCEVWKNQVSRTYGDSDIGFRLVMTE